MSKPAYQSMKTLFDVTRRDFLTIGGAASAGLLLGTPALWAEEKDAKPQKPATNIQEALAVPKPPYALPGPFPGRVIKVADEAAMVEGEPDAAVVRDMVRHGITTLTGNDLEASYSMLFTKSDVVGIKVNPVGPGLISTRLEVVDALIEWLEENGLPRENIVIWDRFDYMLREAGYTEERFPGVQIEALQDLDLSMWNEDYDGDDSGWLSPDGAHKSLKNFDQHVYYWADVDGPKEKAYLNQHVTNNKYSFFGKLLTKKLTKIINVPVFKNTGNGISMATKNLAYAAVCNTGRLHRPLFFDVCTEVLAFPCVRDKLVLNVNDGLRAQYDGGPGANEQFTYIYNTLFFATDPFAMDRYCHDLIVAKRKEMGVQVNEHPRYTGYLRYAEELGLGVGRPEKIEVVEV